MYLIAGLGNPGKQYEATRHNMGFDTVDCLVEKHNIPQGGVKFNAMYGKGIIGGEKSYSDETAFLYEFKRRSDPGDVRLFQRSIRETELIVIYDDIDLEPGQLRIRKRAVQADITGSRISSAALELKNLSASVLVSVQNRKTGIWQILCWVIFSDSDRKLVDEGINDAAEAVEMILSEGVDAAMNKYNRKKPKN